MGNYKVSVIIPLYNKEKYIQRAIDSVLKQTYQNFEIIIINDGSTDNSCDIVRQVQSDKIKLISQENKGVSAARNNGIIHAKGEWIAFLDADDEWLPTKLFKQIEVVKQNKDLNWVAGQFIRIRFDGKVLLEKSFKKKWFYKKNVIKDGLISIANGRTFWIGTVLVKKDFIMRNGRFDEGLKIGEEMNLWLRFLVDTSQLGYITEPIAKYYMGLPLSLMAVAHTEFNPQYCKNSVKHLIYLLKYMPNHRKIFLEKIAQIKLEQAIKYMIVIDQRDSAKELFREFWFLFPLLKRAKIGSYFLFPYFLITILKKFKK